MRFVRFLRALLLELSDETAYRKHLERSGHRHSAAEWRRFSDQHNRAKYSRARCC